MLMIQSWYCLCLQDMKPILEHEQLHTIYHNLPRLNRILNNLKASLRFLIHLVLSLDPMKRCHVCQCVRILRPDDWGDIRWRRHKSLEFLSESHVFEVWMYHVISYIYISIMLYAYVILCVIYKWHMFYLLYSFFCAPRFGELCEIKFRTFWRQGESELCDFGFNTRIFHPTYLFWVFWISTRTVWRYSQFPVLFCPHDLTCGNCLAVPEAITGLAEIIFHTW